MKKIILITMCLINICALILLFGCGRDYNIDELYMVEYNGDYTYNYVVKDINDNVLLSDEGISREPKVKVINEKLLSVSVQTGTGISTRWTIYCDVFNARISDTYYSVLGEYRENVVFVNHDNGDYSVVIQDIFNKEEYYKEIILEDASKVTDPIVDFEKLDDDKVKIVYLKGDNFLETELTIEI